MCFLNKQKTLPKRVIVPESVHDHHFASIAYALIYKRAYNGQSFRVCLGASKRLDLVDRSERKQDKPMKIFKNTLMPSQCCGDN